MGLLNFLGRRGDAAPSPEPDGFALPEVKRYYALSEKINDSRIPPERRLEYCEASLPILAAVTAAFIQVDGELPPCMPCRDFGPEYYMRFGRFAEAARMVGAMNACRAYYPDGPGNDLEYLERYKATADVAVRFLRENPGYIQKDIYRTMRGAVDDDCLKHFIRCSYQIRKEPCGKTNRLYVAEPTRMIEISCPCSAKFRVIIRKLGVSLHNCPKCGQQVRVNVPK